MTWSTTLVTQYESQYGPPEFEHRAEGDDVLRSGIAPQAVHGRRHLVGHGAGDDHEVGLPRPVRERITPSRMKSCRDMLEAMNLDGAAGQGRS
jgi:hypothetical protein